MASIWKHPNSRNWTACFTAVVGQDLIQLKRSTGTSDKKIARRVADEIECIAQGDRTTDSIFKYLETLTDLKLQRKVRSAADEILKKTTGQGLLRETTRGYIGGWLERSRNEVTSNTMQRYEQVARDFIVSLGDRADQDFSLIRKDDIVRFRDAEAERVAASTANVTLKIVRMFCSSAFDDEVIPRDPAKGVKVLKTGSKSSRRPFTLKELRRILNVCDDEWKSLVLLGVYTGARLGDLACLTWANVNIEDREFSFTTRKTGGDINIPIAGPVLSHLETVNAGDDPTQPLHPRAFKIVTKEGRTGTLSRQFGEVLVSAGLAAPRSHQAKKEGSGRSAKRLVNELSFHALRHTAVSMLKSAGVGDAIARDIVGHESVEISRRYTTIDAGTKRDAMDKLPDIFEV